MAGRAAAGTIITRMIVRTHEVEQRIVQPRLLQIEKHGINTIERTEAALGKTARGFAGRFEWIWITDLKLLFATTLENAENVARLTQGEAWQRINEWQDAVLLYHLRRHRNR